MNKNHSGRGISAANYQQLSGVLNASRKRVYAAFRQICASGKPSATTNEVIVWLDQHGQGDHDLDQRGVSARVTELVAYGLLKVVGKTKDERGIWMRLLEPVPQDDAVPSDIHRPTRQQLERRIGILERQLAREQRRTVEMREIYKRLATLNALGLRSGN